MQVKKFEARTMKEALEMVKTQMGPEAIILSARDNVKSYGLLGQGSVEITAAIREEANHKKKFAESRMRESDREKFQQSPAHVQKKIINKYVDQHLNKTNVPQTNLAKPAVVSTQKSGPRYIDIQDDHHQERSLVSVPTVLQEKSKEAQMLWQQMHPREEEINNLKQEVNLLKNMLEKFTAVPQHMINTSYPGLSFGIPYELSSLFVKLTDSGVSDEIAAEILNLAKDLLQPGRLKQKAIVEGWVARYILETTSVAPQKLSSQLQCFVGPVGSGKTTTLVKLASHLMVRENKKIAIVTTDTQKVGAVEQMKIYAHILNVPFAVIKNASEWEKVIRQLSYADYILCDFSSTNFKNPAEVSNLKNLLPRIGIEPQVHLVLSTLMGEQDLGVIGSSLAQLAVSDVLFTGLDQSLQHGCIYNFIKSNNMSLYGFGIGPKIPEDFEYATKERVLDLIFKLTTSNLNTGMQNHEGGTTVL